MPFTPLDPPDQPQVPFITVAELGDYIGRDVSVNGGTLAVAGACEMVRTMAERQFNRGTTTYALDGTGTDALLLPDLPVNSAGTVLVNGGSIADYTINSNGILFRGSAGANPRPVWPLGRQNILVTADHGYATVDLPPDIKMVALSIAARLVIQGVALEENIGVARIKYGTNATDLTNGEKAILRKYKPTR